MRLNRSAVLILLCLIFCCNIALANTETFQIRIPSKQSSLSNEQLIIEENELIHQIDLKNSANYNKPFKFTIIDEVLMNNRIVIKLKHGNETKSKLYTFKVCWSAIMPVSYVSDSFEYYNQDNTTTYIIFNFENDSYPPLQKGTNVSINCSVSKMFLSSMPVELKNIIALIIILLTNIFIIDRYVINFYNFFKDI